MTTHYTIYAATLASVEWRASRLVDESPGRTVLYWDVDRNGEAKDPGETFVGTLVVEETNGQ